MGGILPKMPKVQPAQITFTQRQARLSEMIRNAALEQVSGRTRTIYIDATVVDTGAPWSIAPDPTHTFEVAFGTPTPDAIPA